MDTTDLNLLTKDELINIIHKLDAKVKSMKRDNEKREHGLQTWTNLIQIARVIAR